MRSVLVVDDDAKLGGALVRELASHGFTAQLSSTANEAVTMLGARPFDVLLTDLRLGERDGIDLLAQVREVSPATRPVLMSAFATARDYQKAIELGAVRVLCKPFTSSELLAAIQQAVECETGFRGSIHGLSLIDLLQMFHFGRRSLSLVIGTVPTARIHFREGEIIHAERGATVGEDALRAILVAQSGSMHTTVLASVEQTIHQGFQSLVLDVLRQVDEATRDAPVDFLFDEAPAAPSRRDAAAWDDVSTGVRRISPEALAALGSSEPSAIGGSGTDMGPVRDFAQTLSRLAPEWQRVECVGTEVAFALFRRPGDPTLLLLGNVLVGRYAAMRFRSEAGRIGACIAATTVETGETNGKDR